MKKLGKSQIIRGSHHDISVKARFFKLCAKQCVLK